MREVLRLMTVYFRLGAAYVTAISRGDSGTGNPGNPCINPDSAVAPASVVMHQKLEEIYRLVTLLNSQSYCNMEASGSTFAQDCQDAVNEAEALCNAIVEIRK